MQKWQEWVQDQQGNIIPGATVTVRQNGVLAEIYSDDVGTPKNNPFFSDVDGFAFFYAQPGLYDIEAQLAGRGALITDVALVGDGGVATNRNRSRTVGLDNSINVQDYESNIVVLDANKAFTVAMPTVSGNYSFTAALHLIRSNLAATYAVSIPGATVRNIGQYPVGEASSAAYETLFIVLTRVGSDISATVSVGRTA